MANQIIKIPDIGSDDPVDVIELLVGEGDTLAENDSLVVLESAKASVEVPSPVVGKVVKLLIKPGDRVNVGDDLMEVAVEGDAAASAPAADEPATASQDTAAPTEGAVAMAEQNTPASAGSAPSEAAPAAAGASETIKIPDIGSDDPVDVIEILVAVGDDFSENDSLVVLESAKASVEVPAPLSGKVEKLLIKPGDRVSVGDDLMQVISAAGQSAESAQATSAAPQPEKAAAKPTAQPTSIVEVPKSAPAPRPEPAGQPLASAATVHAGPAARKLARELGLELTTVADSSGRNGRITKGDVAAAAKQRIQQAAQAPAGGALAAMPEIDFSKFGEVERVATSGLRRTAAKHLQRSWQSVPQVTQNELVDVTDLEAFRKAENKRDSGQKLTMLAFVARAVVTALKEFPDFNSSLSPDFNELIMKKYIHLGFAADTDRGLVVPVLRDADKLGIKGIAKGVSDLAKAARDRKLTPRDMQGACFTISSLGGIGGTSFTPLVNSPEVAILGISRADWQPRWNADKGEFEPRLMMPLSLSYDHRVIDGANAARFIVYLRDALQDLRRLLF